MSALIGASLLVTAVQSPAACMYRAKGMPHVWLYAGASEIESYSALGYETRDCAQHATPRAKFIERICGEASKPNATSDVGSAVFGVPYSKVCASAQAAQSDP